MTKKKFTKESKENSSKQLLRESQNSIGKQGESSKKSIASQAVVKFGGESGKLESKNETVKVMRA